MSLRRLHLAALLLLAASCAISAETLHKPYVMASMESGTIADQLEGVASSLEDQGFDLVGQYAPWDGARVLVVTSPELIQNAAESEFGGFGAVVRVSLTQVGETVQVAYTHPTYMAHAYRLQGDNEAVAQKLEAALGALQTFGSKKGLSTRKLRKYHYTVMMPYFDDQDELAKYGSYEETVTAVEAGLAAGIAGTEKIYRVDVGPGVTLFGVALQQGAGADAVVIKNCDREEYKHTAYMPYEILVRDNKAYALPGKFRIAVSFPDLSMGTFMKIVGAPGSIKKALKDVARAQ